MGSTYRAREAMRSSLVKLKPALHLMKFPVVESKETSVPRAKFLLPKTPEKLRIGFAVNPMLALIPAYSCRY